MTDATGTTTVKVWDRACQELLGCTANKLRESWEAGVEDDQKQQDILKHLNANLTNDIRASCTAKVWSYGGREKKQQVQVNVDLIELSEL